MRVGAAVLVAVGSGDGVDVEVAVAETVVEGCWAARLHSVNPSAMHGPVYQLSGANEMVALVAPSGMGTE